MPHHTPLISTIVVGLVWHLLSALLRTIPPLPLIGYLLAGVLAGPFTPGYVADQGLANQLAEIGVILLMFGVGLHFSLKDLLGQGHRDSRRRRSDRQCYASRHGSRLADGVEYRRRHRLRPCPLGGQYGGSAAGPAGAPPRRNRTRHIAVGWLIVEDLAMVLTLALPGLANAARPRPTIRNPS